MPKADTIANLNDRKIAATNLQRAIHEAWNTGLFNREILDSSHPDIINGFVDAVSAAVKELSDKGSNTVQIITHSALIDGMNPKEKKQIEMALDDTDLDVTIGDSDMTLLSADSYQKKFIEHIADDLPTSTLTNWKLRLGDVRNGTMIDVAH